MEQTELKPCPFCGQPVAIRTGADSPIRWAKIACSFCGVEMHIGLAYQVDFSVRQRVIDTWNRRA